MTQPNASAASPGRSARRELIGYALLLAGLMAFGLHALVISGPAMRRAAQDDLARTIAEEDRQFCARFGLQTTSTAFAACSAELAIIRQKQADRDTAAAPGIL